MAGSVHLLRDRGLQVDDRVRWRPTGKRAWVVARVTGLEADGSIGCVDADGRARAVVAERLEVERRTGRVGARRWARLADPQQLVLFADAAVTRPAAAAARAGAPPKRRARR